MSPLWEVLEIGGHLHVFFWLVTAFWVIGANNKSLKWSSVVTPLKLCSQNAPCYWPKRFIVTLFIGLGVAQRMAWYGDKCSLLYSVWSVCVWIVLYCLVSHGQNSTNTQIGCSTWTGIITRASRSTCTPQLCRLVWMIQAQDSHKMPGSSESPMFPWDVDWHCSREDRSWSRQA